jgi:hypothetical protein
VTTREEVFADLLPARRRLRDARTDHRTRQPEPAGSGRVPDRGARSAEALADHAEHGRRLRGFTARTERLRADGRSRADRPLRVPGGEVMSARS